MAEDLGEHCSGVIRLVRECLRCGSGISARRLALRERRSTTKSQNRQRGKDCPFHPNSPSDSRWATPGTVSSRARLGRCEADDYKAFQHKGYAHSDEIEPCADNRL